MTYRYRLYLLLALLPTLALAQFQWPDNGKSIRQGAHLGWNGAAVCAGNDVALFYYDCLRDGTRDVWGTRVAPNGQHVWGQDGQLIAGDISEQRAPVVAAYPDGSVLVVWEDYSVGRFRDLKAQRYGANGEALWSPADGVIVIQQARDQFDVKLAINNQNDAFIAFTDDRLTDGTDTRLNSYAQILTSEGERVGPLDGIQLLTRNENYNQPIDVACVGNDAFILSMMAGTGDELVIQKLSPDGTIGFPGDEAVGEFAYSGKRTMIAIDNALAVAWTASEGGFQYGDARLKLIDANRSPLPGWSAEGNLVGTGEFVQSVVKMAEASDGGVVIALASYEFDPDESAVTVSKYARSGALQWGPVEIGTAALHMSPLDWTWDGDNLIINWAETVNWTDHQVRTQKLSATGVKLWDNDGNVVWHRENKKIRTEIEKPENAAARLVIVSGRAILQPESLFVADLNSAGQLAGPAEFLSGGWTYDSYFQRAARIDDRKLAVIWSDSRASLNTDIYFQFIDAYGNALLEPNGRKLSPNNDFTVYAPPAVTANGSGGAFLAWIGDSLGQSNNLYVYQVDAYGNQVWNSPAVIRTSNGFNGQSHLIPDGSGGVFVAFTRFNTGFVARMCVAHVNSSGEWSWVGDYHEFAGDPANDLTLTAAVPDGAGGCYLAGMTGPWQDTQAVLFHINSDGTFGTGWSNEGRIFGGTMTRDRNARAVRVGDHVLLTWEQPQSDGSAIYDVRGVLINSAGENLWSAQGRRLSTEDAAVVRHQLSQDGQGGFLLSYEDFRNGSQTKSYVARFDADGQPIWSGTERLACTYDGDQSFTSMTHDGNGGAWMVWEDVRNSDLYSEIDVFGTHINSEGEFASVNGFTWPEEGYPVCDVPTYQQEPVLIPWDEGGALAIWKDLRSSNPGRCCGAGAVGDIFNNVYAQVMSEVTLDADDNRDVTHPKSFTLSAYPNPFNPSTQLTFSLPQNAHVKLTIFNLLGQATEVVLDAPLVAGDHAYTWTAQDLPSGIYFAKLETSTGLSTVQKLTLLK